MDNTITTKKTRTVSLLLYVVNKILDVEDLLVRNMFIITSYVYTQYVNSYCTLKGLTQDDTSYFD